MKTPKNGLITILCLTLAACGGSGGETKTQSNTPLQSSGELKSRPSVSYSDELIDDITAFTDVAHKVRFFYPSESVAMTNWDAFIAESIIKLAEVEHGERRRIAQELLTGVAPFLQVTQQPPAAPSDSDNVTTWLANSAVKNLVYTRELVSGSYNTLREDERHAQAAHFKTSLLGQTAYVPVYLKQSEAQQGSTYYQYKTYNLGNSVLDKEVCMSTTSRIWAEIQHFWPYFGEVQVDWKPELRKMIASCLHNDAKQTWREVHRSLKLLQDNHINVALPASANPFAGLDWQLPLEVEFVEGKPTVVSGTADALNKVSLGDEVLAIDNVSVNDIVAQKSPWMPIADNLVKSWTLQLALRQSEQTPIEVHLRRPDDTEYSQVLEPLLANEIEFSGQPFLRHYDYYHTVLDNQVHHVIVYNLTPENLSDLKLKLASAKGVILDLRHYPASFEAWRAALGWFVDKRTSAAPMYLHWQSLPDQLGKHAQLAEQYIYPGKLQLRIPMVALSSRMSLSQNEHALAYVQNAGIPILGESTVGINGNVVTSAIFSKNGDSEVKFRYTGMRVTQNDGSVLIAKGIKPTYEVPITRQAVIEKRDNQLESAQSYVTELINSL
ncbi:S41 family peptidase [Pseudoalteromonas sp. S16_S37]|uniref:S41 family peptidase n=1 Tax=Pseudoalteromonas sp. S16_S37 TaxID=2720228 RepID=UPI0016801558|nr:hypothetical protein [Pseudoalteromonas sp. S16_S37]MBD1584583.1 hypothetical protein [Pseudoalteromonas sp. S16_S37]